jgi:hypothetical protein
LPAVSTKGKIMTQSFHRFLLAAGVSLVATVAAAHDITITHLDADNSRAEGVSVVNTLSPELSQAIVAEGKMKLENASEVNGYYGYANDGPLSPAAGAVQS